MTESNTIHVEKQWEEWQKNNPVTGFCHVDTEDLKSSIISELTETSKMDVKEYTLYQKWCEIKEKYKTRTISTLFGDSDELVNPNQEKLIKKSKENIWIPKSPEDFNNLRPVPVICGENVNSDLYNTLRTFTSSMKNNSNIGRNLFYTVNDENTGKYLGVICISSDFLDLTPRDTHIGWNREIKTQGKMINYTGIGSSIVPFQPLGYNYMGGKLLSLMCLSDTVQKDWRERYGDILIAVTTTSLYGNTKMGGLSQYDGLDHWKKMGFSSGSVAFEPTRKLRLHIFDWIKENYTRKYFEWWSATNPQGLPLKRDHKNRSLSFAYSKLGIPKEITKADHQRGIYFSELYTNSCEFLRKEITEKDLIKSFDTSEETLSNIWKEKYAKPRMKMLVKKNKFSSNTLFYDDLIYLTWEETREKYLGDVGR